MDKITIKVQYCGGWGFKRYYDALTLYLDEQFPEGKLSYIEAKDKGVTGNFEVTIEETGEKIHSVRWRGHTKAQTQGERDAIVAKIKEVLA